METIMVELSPEISLHALRTDTTLVMISQSINQSISPSLTHSIFATVLNLPWGLGHDVFWLKLFMVCVYLCVYVFASSLRVN